MNEMSKPQNAAVEGKMTNELLEKTIETPMIRLQINISENAVAEIEALPTIDKHAVGAVLQDVLFADDSKRKAAAINDILERAERQQFFATQLVALAAEVKRLQEGLAHYADRRRWILSDKQVGDADLYQSIDGDDIMLTHGFEYAEQILKQENENE